MHDRKSDECRISGKGRAFLGEVGFGGSCHVSETMPDGQLPERENGRLKKQVAELTLDKAILKEAANPNF